MTITRLALLFAAAGLVGGCATTPAPAPPVDPAPPTPAPQEVVQPAPPPAPSGPATPASQAQAQKIALATIEALQAGNEDQARSDLQRALQLDANNKLAAHLLRQITVDPVTALGRDSFAYTVKPNDSLSLLAKRYLGDVYSFYILARYNNIAVPRQLAGVQVLRIPGKAPPAVNLDRETARATPAPSVVPGLAPAPPSPAPTPIAPPPAVVTPGEAAWRSGQAAEKSGDLDRALVDYRRAAGLDQPQAAPKAEQVRKLLVTRRTGAARTAFAKQDLDGAVRNWDRVLELDPTNDNARLEREKAANLKDKLDRMK